ncbi:slipin family protein [Hippea alviniae]|uniref:slipin family protein n=1 Tax=Hippea alviniae TaxID=1279027 RepID=UPI0003B5D0C9|nr:slipin family protein [Hippea alviniae]
MFTFVIVAIVLVIFLTSIRIVKEYERAVIFRLGRVIGAKGPGIFFLWPIIDTMIKVNLRLITVEIQPQDVITKDNVTIKISAVVYFKVIDPVKSVIQVNNYFYAIEQLAQTTLRSVCGQMELDRLLSEREHVNAEIQSILDKHSDSWGVKVTLVELKQIDLPQDMQRAMARQAEAERDRRAKIISAEGEYQAAQKLKEAAQIISEYPQALQLRYLQTLNEISAKNNTTTILPIPLDLLRSISQKE